MPHSFLGICLLIGLLIGSSAILMSFAQPLLAAKLAENQSQQWIIENQLIDESSGLAQSRLNPKRLWTHNDSGNAPIIFAMDQQGANQGSFFLDNVINRDWEDMASFTLDDKAYLLIAETGDNFRVFLHSYLYIFKEPIITEQAGPKVLAKEPQQGFIDFSPVEQSFQQQGRKQNLSPIWTIGFQYPDNQSYDVEAVSVDSKQKKVYLLSKRTKNAYLFELPLIPPQNAHNDMEEPIITAKFLAKLPLKKPLAMDMSPDGNLAVVLTYGRVHVYHKKDSQSWKEVMQKPGLIIRFSGLFQAEAISLDANQQGVFISSERLPAKLLYIPLNP